MTKHYELFKGMKPLEVLSKMQHLGVATRLLDITKNPLVGIFFAVDSLKPLDRTIVSDATINNYSSSSEKGVKGPNLYTEKKESSYETAESNKQENAELIIFKCPNKEIKNYDSDTVKLLSCLPLLKEENQKKLLADAINEYLIQVFVEHALSKFIYYDDGRLQLHNFDLLNDVKSLVLKEIVEKVTTQIKKIYYLDEYGSTSHIGIVLRDIGIKDFNKIKDFGKKSKYDILVESGKPFYDLKVELYNGNNSDKRIFDISRIKITIMIQLLPLFGLKFLSKKLSFSFTKGENNDLYPIVVFDANDSYFMFKDQDCVPLNDNPYDILSQLSSGGGLMSINESSDIYKSKSMEELYQKVKSFYPEFRRCARPLDIINGAFVYPIVNTERMRAQKGLFALYGLSQYWNFKKYMEYQRGNCKTRKPLQKMNLYAMR